jgi:hypothetical protein
MGSTLRKGSQQSGQSAGISGNMAQLGGQLGKLGLGILDPAAKQFINFLNTGTLPQAFTGTIGTQEQELAAAKEGILSGGSRGGQLTQGLSELPLKRLMMRDALRGDVFNSALGLGNNLISGGMGGMGNAASNLNALGAQRMQQNAQFTGGLGQAIGKGIGGATGKCWIAERLYGPMHLNTRLLRTWFNLFIPHWWVSRLYGQVGEWVSRQAWVWLLRPVFDRFVVMAQRDFYGHGV